MRVASAGLSFLFFVVLARGRGGAFLGEFSTLLAFFIFFQSLPLLGLHVLLVRDVAADHGSLPRLGANAALLGLVMAVPCALALGIGGTLLYPSHLQTAFWYIGLAMFPTALVVVSESLLTGQERVDVVAALSVGENLLRLVLWLVALWLGAGVGGFFLALLLGRAAAVFGHYRWGRLKPAANPSLVAPAVLRQLVASCPTFFAILLMATAISRLDFIVLSKLGTLHDVGLYAAAYKIYELALMVPQLLSLALFPALARAMQRSPADSGRLVRSIFRIYVLLGVPCAVLGLALSRPLMATLYGEAFSSAGTALRWLIAAPLLAALDQVLTTVLIAHHRQGLDLKVLVVSCTGYALLLGALIPRFGYEGAAAATLAVAVLQLGYRYWLVRTRLGIPGVLSTLMRPLAAAAVMAAVCTWLGTISIPLAFAAGVAAYAAALAAFGAVSRQEIRGLRTAFEPRVEAAS